MRITIEQDEPNKFEFINEDEDEDENNCEQRKKLGTVKKYYLNIEYEEKDDFKKQYKVKWDPQKGKWYWLGQLSKMPQVLKDRMCE